MSLLTVNSDFVELQEGYQIFSSGLSIGKFGIFGLRFGGYG